jgi:hypothetical protein
MPAESPPLPCLPPPASDAPSVLAFGMIKGGSTLLFDLLTVLAPAAGLTWFSLNDQMFRLGVKEADIPEEASRLFLPQGYCYGGFRDWPPHDIPILRSARAVWLIRDPHDMIVSPYHSTVASHRIPEPTESSSRRRMSRSWTPSSPIRCGASGTFLRRKPEPARHACIA